MIISAIISIGMFAASSQGSLRVFDLTIRVPHVTPSEQEYLRLTNYEHFTVVRGHLTNHKLVDPIQQLQCVGDNCGEGDLVTSMTCRSFYSRPNPNMVGSSESFEDDDGNPQNPEEHVMVCMAENLDPQYKLIDVKISCEGYLDPVHIYEIIFVLTNSCGVIYRLGHSDVPVPKSLLYIYHMSHYHLLQSPYDNQFIATHHGHSSFSSRCHSANLPAPCAPEIVNARRKDADNKEL
jgi:hypothetical protein